MSEPQPNQMTNFNSFADWCLHKDSLSPAARHTVEALLHKAGTSDCNQANRILSSCTELHLYNNQTTDLSPLSGLTNLTQLNLYNTRITDLSPLSGLINLTQLYLNDNRIIDLSGLSGLTNLTQLYLINQITDLSSLSGLTNLTELHLYNGTYLYPNNNQISDWSPLSRLINLTQLYLNNNQITDLSALSGLINLTQLYLHNNQITDLSGLSGLTNLTRLHLGGNQITDLSGLSGLTNLTHLHLYNNQITDLSPLSELTNLTQLYINNNQIIGLSGLSRLTNLTQLNLGSNQITDLSPLSGLINLTQLYLGNNQITDLSELSGLTNLTRLNLGGNQITDLSELSGLTNLTELYLQSNPISNLSLLRSLQQKWRTLLTKPIDRQKATEIIKSTYAVIGQEEPEIIVCSSPLAGAEWLRECQQLGVSLAQSLSQLARKSLSLGVWTALQQEINFQLGRTIGNNLTQHLLQYYQPLSAITPEDLVAIISISQYCVSIGWVFEQQSQEALECLNQLFEQSGWIFPFEKVCVVCDRPTKLSLDSQDRLHAEGEPAIQFADGWHTGYYYHGVKLPEKYGKLHPHQWQAQWILEEDNAELRRILIQGIGYARICQELQATELDFWQEYTLLKLDADIDGFQRNAFDDDAPQKEPIHLLKMTCPSTGFIHAMRVPPDITSARAAIRWINWDIDPEEFSVQT